MKVSKEFILEAHKDACSTWKNKIEKEFPDLFVEGKLEVGKWYKSDSKGLWFITEFNNVLSGQKSFGISRTGMWQELDTRYSTGLTPATKEEVETALIAEAKKRGFEEGCSFIYIYPNGSSSNVLSSSGKLDFDHFESNNIIYIDGFTIFENGIWATIIEKPKFTKEEAEKKFNIKIV